MTKTDLVLVALFAFYFSSPTLSGSNSRSVSILSHHEVINAGSRDRRMVVHDSLLLFVSNDVHSQLVLKACSNDWCSSLQFWFQSWFWPKLRTHKSLWVSILLSVSVQLSLPYLLVSAETIKTVFSQSLRERHLKYWVCFRGLIFCFKFYEFVLEQNWNEFWCVEYAKSSSQLLHCV